MAIGTLKPAEELRRSNSIHNSQRFIPAQARSNDKKSERKSFHMTPLILNQETHELQESKSDIEQNKESERQSHNKYNSHYDLENKIKRKIKMTPKESIFDPDNFKLMVRLLIISLLAIVLLIILSNTITAYMDSNIQERSISQEWVQGWWDIGQFAGDSIRNIVEDFLSGL